MDIRDTLFTLPGYHQYIVHPTQVAAARAATTTATARVTRAARLATVSGVTAAAAWGPLFLIGLLYALDVGSRSVGTAVSFPRVEHPVTGIIASALVALSFVALVVYGVAKSHAAELRYAYWERMEKLGSVSLRPTESFTINWDALTYDDVAAGVVLAERCIEWENSVSVQEIRAKWSNAHGWPSYHEEARQLSATRVQAAAAREQVQALFDGTVGTSSDRDV